MREFSLLLCGLFLSLATQAQLPDSLRSHIDQLLVNKDVRLGFSMLHLEKGDTLSIRGEGHFPMQSVFKFHIALCVLDLVDKGVFTLTQKVKIEKKDMPEKFYSPLRDANPNGGSFSIAKLIRYEIVHSDNVACDALLRLIGGPEVVNAYFISHGFSDISIHINEQQMQKNWDNMFQNWTTPIAATNLLRAYYLNNNKLLSEKSYNFLWQTMKDTETGQMRIKGKLPEGTIVAHKTGSSGSNDEGLTEALNDIGIVFLPNGDHLILSFFVSHSYENDTTNEAIISEITELVYTYYTK